MLITISAELKVTSLNCSFCLPNTPKPKDSLFTAISNAEKQQIFALKGLYVTICFAIYVLLRDK